MAEKQQKDRPNIINYDVLLQTLACKDNELGQKLKEYIIQNQAHDVHSINLQDILDITSYSNSGHIHAVQLSLLIEQSMQQYMRIPSHVCMSIAEFAVSAISIAFSSDLDKVSLDQTSDELKITAPSETHCHLATPCLLGADALPFNVSFTVNFQIGQDRGVGKHGGIFLGIAHERLTSNLNRFGSAGIMNVIDWIDRTGDRGYHIYENVHQRDNRSLWNRKRCRDATPGKHWIIKYVSKTECQFFVDNEYITKFQPVRCDGYVAFWVWNGSITISDLEIVRV